MGSALLREIGQMRCLYCGIKLKIAKQAKVIRHCPECSLRIECEGAQETLLRTVLNNLKGRKAETRARVRKAAASSLLHH